MKNLNHYLTENKNEKLLEKKVLSPVNIKLSGLDKKSIDSFKKLKLKSGNLDISFIGISDYFYSFDNELPYFFKFLEGTGVYSSTMNFDINGTKTAVRVQLSKSGKSELIVTNATNTVEFIISSTDYAKYIGSTENKVEGFSNLLEYLFKKYTKELSEFVKNKEDVKVFYIIDAGKISPTTGNTQHGWSIYNTKTKLAVIGNTTMLYGADMLKVGDKIKVVDDQNHSRVYFNEVEVKDIINSTPEEFINYSRKNGAEVPVKAFSKQPGKFRYSLYSIK